MQRLGDTAEFRRFQERLLAKKAEIWERYGGPPPDEYYRPSPCSYCKGAGWIRERQRCDDDSKAGYHMPALAPCPKCTEQPLEQQRRERAVGESGLGRLQHITFERLTPYPAQQQQWMRCIRWATAPDGWLLLSGNYRTGKTTFAMCIGNALLQKDQAVLFRNVPKMLDELRDTYNPDSTVRFADRMASVLDMPILILDDYGQQMDNPWVAEKLFQIADHRLLFNLPTVVTTNLSLQDFERRSPRLFHRIDDESQVDVVLFDMPPIHGNGKPPATQEPF